MNSENIENVLSDFVLAYVKEDSFAVDVILYKMATLYEKKKLTDNHCVSIKALMYDSMVKEQ